MHVVLEPRYLQRNPHLAFSQTVEDVSAAGAQASVWPISGDTTTASFIPGLMSAPHAGRFTAASGVHIHRGDALPAGHRDSIFICESAQNLVQRQVLIAERRDVHLEAGPERPRLPLVARHLVPAGLRRQRSRRRPLHRRHVPQDHRPPAVRPGTEPGAARLRSGEGARPDLSGGCAAAGSGTGERSISAG